MMPVLCAIRSHLPTLKWPNNGIERKTAARNQQIILGEVGNGYGGGAAKVTAGKQLSVGVLLGDVDALNVITSGGGVYFKS